MCWNPNLQNCTFAISRFPAHSLIPRKTELKNNSCTNCKSTDNESSQQDLIDYISLLASQTGTNIEVISGKTEHGSMLSSLGKIGAILRNNPNHG